MHPGFVSYYLTAGTYSFANNQVFPNKLLCIEDGQIEVNPPIGDSFIWSSGLDEDKSIQTRLEGLEKKSILTLARPGGTTSTSYKSLINFNLKNKKNCSQAFFRSTGVLNMEHT